MKIVCVEDFYGSEITEYLRNETSSGKRYLYIARAEVLKERAKNERISDRLSNLETCFYNLTAHINKMVYSNGNYLSQTDMYYILKKTVDFYFSKDRQKHIVYKNMYYSIYELYKFLLFHDTEVISDKIQQLIKESYTQDCKILFDMYLLYKKVIENTVTAIRNGNSSYKIDELDITISVNSSNNEHYDTFIALQKSAVNELLKDTDSVFMDGYFIFNDLESYLLSHACELGKEIVFITKNLENDIYKDTIINGIFSNTAGFKETPEVICLGCDNKKQLHTALEYVKNNFYTGALECSGEIQSLFKNGSIVTYEPFVSRTGELTYVAKLIGNLIKERVCSGDSNIVEFIENEIALTSPLRKDVIARLTDEAFKDNGYFTYREKPIKLFEQGVKENTFEKTYYEKKNFLMATVLFDDGQPLTHAQKRHFFEVNFKRIKISTPKKTIANMPVLDFIFQLYDISNKGITPNRFKALLLSNWYYHTGASEIMWDKYVGVFRQIEPYFENITTVPDWILKIRKITALREETIENPNYKYHPFNSVNKQDLMFLTDVLREIDLLSNEICAVKGNLQNHLDMLKEKIKIGKILSIKDEDLTAEQSVIKTFYEIIQNMTGHSSIQNYDSMFFVQHLKNILYNTADETEEYERDTHNYNLSMTNMLNLKTYNYVFAIGMEADKFPRKRTSSYPFTKDVMRFIKDINIRSQELDYMELQSVMDEFSFKNILDFTGQKLCFSITEYENKKKNEYSVFVEDIATLFDSNLLIEKVNNAEELPAPKEQENTSVFVKEKKTYTIKELATFLLCPHLYFYIYVLKKPLAYMGGYHLRLYAESLLYVNLMEDFAEYNCINNRYYSEDDNSVYKILNDISQSSFKKTFKYFDYFSDYDKIQMQNRAMERAENFIKESVIEYTKYPVYSVRKVLPKIYDCGDFSLCAESDTAVIGKGRKEKRINQIKLYLDFLVMKSNDINLNMTHYADMIKALKSNKAYVDRVFLIKRIIDKINIQFDSVYFEDDGKTRARELVEIIRKTDFSTVKPCTSNFCNYCIMTDKCRFSKQITREE